MKSALEKYIVAINEKDEDTINMLTDENTVSVIESLNAEYIKIKGVKYDPRFNSEDTPKDRFIAFEIKYDNGNKTSESKWVALEKVNPNWVIRSVAKA